jgi:hypothetical protein
VRVFRGQVFVDHETVGKLPANAVRALGTVGYASLNGAWPYGTSVVNQARILGHASIAHDALRWYPEPEVRLPTFAEDPLVGRLRLHVRPIGEAKVASVSASG